MWPKSVTFQNVYVDKCGLTNRYVDGSEQIFT